MNKSIQTISFQEFTRLPVRELVKSGGNAVAIEVTTPMGEKTKDYHYVSVPFLFGTANAVEHPASEVISWLREQELESIEYLIDKWKETL